MLIVTSTFTRPDVSIPFTPVVQEFIDHRESVYIQTGKILSRQVTDSEDGLVRTLITEWRTRDDFNNFRNDPVAVEYRIARRQYFDEHNISATHHYKFIPTEFDPA